MKYRIAIGILLAIGLAPPMLAQVPTPAMSEQQVGPDLPQLRAMLLPAQGVVESRVTTGKPYSAEATTEFVQVLGDGNKIARKTTVRIYRDGEGRTRREELGPDGQARAISIYDPVAHVSYVLNPATKVANKAAVRVIYPAERSAQLATIVDKVQAEREAQERAPGKVALVAPSDAQGQLTTEEMRKRQTEVVVSGGGGGGGDRGRGRGGFAGIAAMPAVSGGNKEPIGSKVIDGVPVDGTRATMVIPAGAIGNQQPLTIVSEQWFSPDLDIFVMTKHSDPRTGETTYSLSNIVRAEPAAGLFDVPADYTIRESSYMRQPAMR